MKITFLGTGTSQGVPVIGCNCPVCTSKDRRDKRFRTSIHIDVEQVSIVVDTGPDFRMQMLNNHISKLDAVILTHEHNDHVAGLDDVRPFNFLQRQILPLYASPSVVEIIKDRFQYIFKEDSYPGAPRIEAVPIEMNATFSIKGITITPILVYHAKLPVIGLRINNFCYITDANYIPESEYHKIEGAEVLVINALRKEKHNSHFSLSEAIHIINKFNIPQAYLTHISHTMGKTAEMTPVLPDHISFAYDGLAIDLD